MIASVLLSSCLLESEAGPSLLGPAPCDDAARRELRKTRAAGRLLRPLVLLVKRQYYFLPARRPRPVRRGDRFGAGAQRRSVRTVSILVFEIGAAVMAVWTHERMKRLPPRWAISSAWAVFVLKVTERGNFICMAYSKKKRELYT